MHSHFVFRTAKRWDSKKQIVCSKNQSGMFLGAEVAKLFRQDGGRSERTKHLKVTLAHYWQTIGWPFESATMTPRKKCMEEV